MQPKAAEFLLTYDIFNECVCDDTLNVSPEYTVSIYTDNYAYVRRNSGRVSVENELRSNSRSRSETRGARAAVSTDDSQTNDKLEREGISRRNEEKCGTSTFDDVVDTRHCEESFPEIASSFLSSLRGADEVCDAAISTGTTRKDDKANEAIHKTECSGKNFDDMSVVDIAYEYSREIFRQGGGSCSQNA